mgnify:FL=1
MKYYGICPASCGELIQGQIESGEYLSSYCVSLYSKAIITEQTSSNTRLTTYPKSIMAMKKTFEFFNEEKALKNLSLEMVSNIPRSKGMASSTADIGAVIGASCAYLGIDITPDDASKIAAKIEPTDSIYYKSLVAMNPLNGNLIKNIGNIRGLKTLILEPRAKIKTKDVRNKSGYSEFKKSNILKYNEILGDFESAIKSNNLKELGKAVNKSSLLNEHLLPKPYLKEVMDIAMSLGAYGVNIAHSGSVVGILLDINDSSANYKSELINNNLAKYFGRMYCLPVIDGGINYGRMS